MSLSFQRRGMMGRMGARIAAVAAVAAVALSVSPAVARAGELEEIEEKVRGIREQISECQQTRIDSLRTQEESQRELEGEREKLDEVQGQLEKQQADLAKIIKIQYTTGSNARMMDMITSTESFSDLTECMEYIDGMENKKLNATARARELRDAQRDVIAKIEEDERLAKEAEERADKDEEALRAKLKEMRPEIDKLLADIKAKLSSKTGNAQLEEAMDFLENIEGINDTQAALVKSAYHTGYAGYQRCEAWAEMVYRNAGVDIGMYGSAYLDYADNCVSSDWDTMPCGSLAFGSGTSVPFSHVGICVFNGGGGPDTIYVMDNEGSRQGKAVTLTEWLKWQTATSSNNGKSGWFGWGYPDGAGIE